MLLTQIFIGEEKINKAALSIFCFGIYVILLGLALVVIPNVILGIFAVPTTTEVWIRIVGMLLLFMGYYYLRAARSEAEMTKFFRWTVHTRSFNKTYPDKDKAKQCKGEKDYAR